MIVNHLRSLSGVDDPADGDRVRTKRRAQAEYLGEPDSVAAGRRSDRAHRLGRRLQRVPVQRRLRGFDRDDQGNAHPGEPGGSGQRRPRESGFDGSRQRRTGSRALLVLVRRQRPGAGPRAGHDRSAEPVDGHRSAVRTDGRAISPRSTATIRIARSGCRITIRSSRISRWPARSTARPPSRIPRRWSRPRRARCAGCRFTASPAARRPA